jgi:hypothetical protein
LAHGGQIALESFTSLRKRLRRSSAAALTATSAGTGRRHRRFLSTAALGSMVRRLRASEARFRRERLFPASRLPNRTTSSFFERVGVLFYGAWRLRSTIATHFCGRWATCQNLQLIPGREVPTPLKVRIVFGDTRLHQVLADVLALTKLNFNACLFSDGLPVTLRFADDIGEILTAIPGVGSKPLSFRHYI